MCEHCRNIQTWRKFDAPKDYLACIAYIQQLVGQGQFELMAEESTCPLEKVKTEDGWADETMAHMIQCKHCGQIFTCVVNTWRGRMMRTSSHDVLRPSRLSRNRSGAI